MGDGKQETYRLRKLDAIHREFLALNGLELDQHHGGRHYGVWKGRGDEGVKWTEAGGEEKWGNQGIARLPGPAYNNKTPRPQRLARGTGPRQKCATRARGSWCVLCCVCTGHEAEERD